MTNYQVALADLRRQTRRAEKAETDLRLACLDVKALQAEVERLRAAMVYAMILPDDTCESVYCILQEALEPRP